MIKTTISTEIIDGEEYDIIFHENSNTYLNFTTYLIYVGKFTDDKKKEFIGRKYLSNKEGKKIKLQSNGTFNFDPIEKKLIQNGYGEEYSYEKIIYKGYFKNGKYCGEGTQYSDEKIIYQGSFIYGNYEGFGKLYDDENRIIYEGNFVNGLKHGTGIEYYYYNDKKQTIKCNWYENKLNGLKIVDGEIEGLYINGEDCYEGTLDESREKLKNKTPDDTISVYANLAAYYKEKLEKIKNDLFDKDIDF